MAAGPSADSELEYLRLAHLNIRTLSLRLNKTEYIGDILRDHEINVLALTETNLDDSLEDSKLDIKNFFFYRKDRNSNGGGVGFYVKDDIRFKRRSDLDHEDLEMIWIEILMADNRPALVGCCYRTSSSKIAYLSKICRKIEVVSNEKKDMFLLGDFNIDWLKESAKKTRIDFASSVCNMNQIIEEPTREEETSSRSTSTCIDHIYTNIPEFCSQTVISVDEDISDHKLIIVEVRRNPETDPLSEGLQSLSFSSSSQSDINSSLEFRRVEEEEVQRLLSLAPFDPRSIRASDLNLFINESKFPSETSENCVSRWILEKILLQQMEEYFNENYPFTQYQTLNNITDQWIRDLKNNKEVGVVFMDFHPSSDAISQLLHKLESYSFSESAIFMMRSFFSEGNSSSCHWTDTHCELPWGSCMTHFLFSVYTNDLKVALKSVVVSGSQLMIYHTAINYKGLKVALRKKSELVRNWLREKRMVLKTSTSAQIRSKTQVKQIQTHLRSTLSVNVKEFNWIKVLRVLLHDAPHLVWTS